jgi:hypothetical protein
VRRLLTRLFARAFGPMRREAEARLVPLGPAVRQETATSLGVGSKGAGQVRGTGTLALTATELAFAQWKPAGLVRIPLAAITAVGTTRSHLGKSVGRDLLHVTWSEQGRDDSIALVVADLGPWLRDLPAPQP